MNTPTENNINHIAILDDASWSIEAAGLTDAVIKVTDNTVASLAESSKKFDQETRATCYSFSGRGSTKCLYYDKDVLRMQSIRGLYRPVGRTALIDATLKAIDDLKATATLYGKHAFLIYLISDGYENDSNARPNDLRRISENLPDNWTLAGFVPDEQAAFALQQCGFPGGNIQIWDTQTVRGVEDMGSVIRQTTEAYMQGREQGIHGYNQRTMSRGGAGLFQMRDFSAKQMQGATPLTRGSYFFLPVNAKERIDEFVARETGKPYVPGRSYYQFMKTETIQPQKAIAVEVIDPKTRQADVFTGPQARAVLGLPSDHSVKVRDIQKDGVTIFVQSTSFNRNLVPGTRLLTLR